MINVIYDWIEGGGVGVGGGGGGYLYLWDWFYFWVVGFWVVVIKWWYVGFCLWWRFENVFGVLLLFCVLYC